MYVTRRPSFKLKSQPSSSSTITMAAAHALSIPEIVLEVAGHVQAEPVSEHRPALARLARVNRLFHDHVVRLLWADLPNMDPLFKLLSNCVSLPTPANAAGGNAHAAPQPLHSMVSLSCLS